MFARQPLQIVCAISLVAAVGFVSPRLEVDVRAWVWLAVAAALVHHLWVTVIWRLELHRKAVSRRLGHPRGFRIYRAGFGIAAFLRFGSMWVIGAMDVGALGIPAWGRVVATALCLAVFAYLVASVHRHFGVDRAVGIDHWEPQRFRGAPMIRRGIHRFSANAMYTFVPSLMWAPVFAFDSPATAVLAVFNHIYLWVHYFATEVPDMAVIYGAAEAAPDSSDPTARTERE